MRRAAVVIAIATLAACDHESCVIEDVVARNLEGVSYLDCGSFPTFDEATFRAAHDCVAAHIAALEPFAVIVDLPSDEGRRAQAYLGVPVGTELELRWVYFDAYHEDTSLTARCGVLTDLGMCSVPLLDMNLCFSCDSQVGLDHCPPL